MDTDDSFVRMLKGTTDFRVWRARVENELMRSHLLGYVLVRGYDGSQKFTYNGEELPPRDGLGQWTVLAERAGDKSILKNFLHSDMESIVLSMDEERRYLVEGAGYAPVNGVYVSTTLVHNDCLTCACRKGGMAYTLYRCCMASKARRWYISYASKKLGTSSDEDFYYVKSDVSEEKPPADG
ncbi:hypothetical protein BBJ28_00024423 [Nothophytophthora sp. Chile5]|nr:hypothetical protein BBJ28_00024423 [Nothophytophthora sp. Chile5]